MNIHYCIESSFFLGKEGERAVQTGQNKCANINIQALTPFLNTIILNTGKRNYLIVTYSDRLLVRNFDFCDK